MLEGHFLLSSGRHSDRYFQCARLLQYPDKAAAVLAPVADALRAAIKAGNLKLDAVCGPAIGGIIVAYELARQLGLPAIFTERDDTGAMSLRRGFAIPRGASVLIAEDVVTTGKSSGESAAVIEALGGKVAALACVVDRRSINGDGDELSAQAIFNYPLSIIHSTPEVSLPWPIFPALTLAAANWDAADCALCKQGIPVEKPGSRKKF
jgi:orotate phosphoribosyltransferase